jgi:hypothetical protein
MKYKTIVMTLALGAASLFTGEVYAQYHHEMTKAERERKDSLKTAYDREEQVQETQDENRMADAKLDRKHTKAKAKEAQRVQREANDAARESRDEVRSERKAQKSRKQADKQADKASKARDQSDSN